MVVVVVGGGGSQELRRNRNEGEGEGGMITRKILILLRACIPYKRPSTSTGNVQKRR